MEVRITANFHFSEMSFARGLSIKFAALWNGQKVFRNTSGRHTKNFQERYIKLKFNCNVLFTCLILRKIYKFNKIYSLFLLVLQTEENAIRLLLCCGDLAETSTQVEYLYFCGSCRSCQYTCGNRHLECLLLFPYPSGFGSTLVLLPQVWGKYFLQVHPWSSSLPFGEEDVHQSCLWACKSSTKCNTFALNCGASNQFTRLISLLLQSLRIFRLVIFYSAFEISEFFTLKGLKSKFSAYFSSDPKSV